MTAIFTVPGDPRGKGRPRFRKVGKYVSTYTDKKTADYEERVKAEYRRQCRGMRFEPDTELKMSIKAFYAIPKSATKGMKSAMEFHYKRPTKTPDADNIAKAIADALNKLCYHDDSQIVDCHISKFYSHQPCVEVEISHAGKRKEQ